MEKSTPPRFRTTFLRNVGKLEKRRLFADSLASDSFFGVRSKKRKDFEVGRFRRHFGRMWRAQLESNFAQLESNFAQLESNFKKYDTSETSERCP